MKKTTFLALGTLLFFNCVNAQVLWSETFDTYPVGNVGTDITGTVPGYGDWYTEIVNGNGTFADFKIIKEPNKGNVLNIIEANPSSRQKRVYKRDLDFYWNKRTPGNNILKVSFDMYTGDQASYDSNIVLENNVILIRSKHGALAGFDFQGDTKSLLGLRTNSRPIQYGGLPTAVGYSNGFLVLNTNSWVTLELYIDYDTSKIYFGIPHLGLMRVYDSLFLLSLKNSTPTEDPNINDAPYEIWIYAAQRTTAKTTNINKVKYDNFNISAVNMAPTVAIKEILPEKFNLYPNPVTNIVNITNSENMVVQQVSIYDISGKQVSSKDFDSSQEMQLNVELLSSGTYMLHIQSDSGTAVKKLIKK